MSVKKYRQMCNVLSRRFWMFKQDWIKKSVSCREESCVGRRGDQCFLYVLHVHL